MRTAIQRLPHAEERALIEVACANGLNRSELRCHMTRQHGQGQGVTRRGRPYDISYDLDLCEYCGNLEPFEVCPAKVLKIKERLLSAPPTIVPRITAIAQRIVTCWLCGGDGPAVCRCHNAPPGRKAAVCNMVCNL